MLIDDGTWVSKECIRISKEAKSQEELELKLAILTADHLLDHIKRLVPPEPPELVKRYRTMGEELKLKFNKENPEWRRTPSVQQWMDETSRVHQANDSEVHWLKVWIATNIDDERREKLRNKLREFVGFDKDEAEQVSAVVEQFGGAIHKTNFAKPKDILWPNTTDGNSNQQ